MIENLKGKLEKNLSVKLMDISNMVTKTNKQKGWNMKYTDLHYKI